jgi:hypothetical protein
MTAPGRLLLLATLAISAMTCQAVRAQSTAPPPAVEPDQNTQGNDNGNLFPPSATPVPGATPGVDQLQFHNRPKASRLLGNKNKKGARTTDLLSDEADADPLEVRIAYRKAKTVAMEKDPALAALLKGASDARTDKDKREWLREYYARLFAEIVKIDPSPALATHVALLSAVEKQRYDPQRRMLAGEEQLMSARGGRR